MANKKYKHILFDLDGTIFDTHEANMQGLLVVLKEFYKDTNETVESLGRFFGIPGKKTIEALNIPKQQSEYFFSRWIEEVYKREDTAKIFDGILPVIKRLKELGYKLGIITSRVRQKNGTGILCDYMPVPIKPYFDMAVCADDVKNPKPAPDSILRYMEITGAKACEILFIGDAYTDLECANDAGVDFGLATWGYCQKDHLNCRYYFTNPFDILTAVKRHDLKDEKWLNIALELNALASSGLTYGHDMYDLERYSRLREIASEIIACHSDVDFDEIHEKLSMDIGYCTPKVDTRAVVFNDKGEILLVKENTGLWSLPGGWCDGDLSVCENVKKEAMEEAGIEVYVKGLIAIFDRKLHNVPKYPCGVLRIFMHCEYLSGKFIKNIETVDAKYFSKENLPVDSLRQSTTTYEQLMVCFDSYNNKDFKVIVE